MVFNLVFFCNVEGLFFEIINFVSLPLKFPTQWDKSKDLKFPLALVCECFFYFCAFFIELGRAAFFWPGLVGPFFWPGSGWGTFFGPGLALCLE